MPKYTFDEEMLDEWVPEGEDEQTSLARYKREPDGQLSEYEFAQCILDALKLPPTSQLALEQLRQVGVTQLTVRYDGGSDEGFAYFQGAKKGAIDVTLDELVRELEAGPLGDKPESPFLYRVASQITGIKRPQWTKEALDGLVFWLATQLLGESYGTGELSIEGSFVADLENNTLTDVAPEEN